MNKRVLASITEIEAKEEYISLAKRIENADYFVYAENRIIEENKILLLYFFTKDGLRNENRRAAFRTFLSEDDYITQDMRVANIKWLTSSIGRLMERWNWEKWIVCVDDESDKNIREFVNPEVNTFEGLKDFQEQIMKNRLTTKHKKITDKIDKQMEMVPELPEDFNNWIEESVLFKSRYIYYEYKSGKKNMKGFCTHCKKDLLVEGPKHNQDGICPKCNSPVIYKAKGKSTLVTDNADAALFQKFDEGFIIRYFKAHRVFKDHYREPKTYWSEGIRDFYYIDSDKFKTYEYAEFRQSGKTRWCEGNNKINIYNTVVYDANLEEVLKNTKWKFSALKEFAVHKPGFEFPVYRYLETYERNQFIEYLVKLKLYRIADGFIRECGSQWINRDGENVQEILKINKSNISILQHMDASLEELRLVQVMEREKLNLPAEQIRYINDNLGCATPLLELSKYTTVNKALKYIKAQAEILKKAPKQEGCHNGWYVKPKSNMQTVYQDWSDYIGFCKELNYDLKNEFILYPKNLKEAHDREAGVLQAKKDREAAEKQRKEREKIKTMSEDLLKKFGMKYKDFVIVPPKDAEELIKEGQTLHHCVGTYIGKVANGRSIVLFVRKADKQEVPYCTMEIVDGKVYQCRGKHNADMTDKLKGLLNKFNKTKLIHKAVKEAV